MRMMLWFTVVAAFVQAVTYLQCTFTIIQSRLLDLKLMLNEAKTKATLFYDTRKAGDSPPNINTLHGGHTEFVAQNKYLGILIDEH